MNWRVVDRLSCLLDANEREAVLGDLTELRVSSRQGVAEIIGLVARRQLRVWAGWRPWFVVTGLVVPLGIVLSRVSRRWADLDAVYAWLYVDNWTWAHLASSGSRRELLTIGVIFLAQCLTLPCCAWMIGFAAGTLSRRTAWMSGALFSGVVYGATLGMPRPGLLNPAHAVVFSVTFYRVVFPIVFRAAFVCLPALAGLRHSLHWRAPVASKR
jgi:hypothetical protein